MRRGTEKNGFEMVTLDQEAPPSVVRKTPATSVTEPLLAPLTGAAKAEKEPNTNAKQILRNLDRTSPPKECRPPRGANTLSRSVSRSK